MRTIPESLLCHSASLYTIAMDDYGAETETLAAELPHVRFEPTSEVVSDTRGKDVRLSARMYMVSSTEASAGDIIKWGGNRYRVQRVKKLYGRSEYHHTEVDLSDG